MSTTLHTGPVKSRNQNPRDKHGNSGGLRPTPLGWTVLGVVTLGVVTTLTSLGASCFRNAHDVNSAALQEAVKPQGSSKPPVVQQQYSDSELARFAEIAKDTDGLKREFPEMADLLKHAQRLGILGEVYDESLASTINDYYNTPSDNSGMKRIAREQVESALGHAVAWAKVSFGEIDTPAMQFTDAFAGTRAFAPSRTVFVDYKLQENGQPQTRTENGVTCELREMNLPLTLNTTDERVTVRNITVIGENGKPYSNELNISIPSGGKADVRLENVPPVPLFDQVATMRALYGPGIGEVATVKITFTRRSDIFSLSEPQPTTQTTQLILMPGNTEGPGRVLYEVPKDYAWKNIPADPVRTALGGPSRLFDTYTFHNTDG